ncbi:MAG: DNA polymerase III subunit alpha, partial [Bacillota bacterium]|nr:DNA polymerase III subunit alpha [Bacillota bacterium]
VQFAKNNVELIGLLKFDFLGLRTLTVLRDTAAMVLENHNRIIDYDRIPMDDLAVFTMISEGRTEAVFQLESPGMTSFMKELRPESLEDIIAGLSLYRPGPMDQIPRYVAAKHDPEKIRYDHPLLEPILNVTYGCLVYQEQVMQVVRDLAGFSMGQSDNVRRAMSKKKPAELAKYKNLFIHGGVDEKNNPVDGALARGVSLQVAEKIFEDVMAFAGYAFPKGHAAAYAVVAYQTAWLKIHYPVEFMAAMLNSYLGSLSQAASYVRVCRNMSIGILPPDINSSEARFKTENGSIRFALAAVKNVGESAIRSLISERQENGPFKSFGDLLRRMDESMLNRKMVESLIRASALDSLGVRRSQMIAVIEPFSSRLASSRRLNMAGQVSLFEMGAIDQVTEAEPEYPELPEFSHRELLGMEKEMLGLYISGHPLDEYETAISLFATLNSSAFSAPSDNPEEELRPAAVTDGDRVIMAGMLVGRKNKTTKNNEQMSFLTIEDLYGLFEVIAFPRVLSDAQAMLREGQVLLIGGRLSIREDDAPKLIAETIALLEADMRRLPTGFEMRMPTSGAQRLQKHAAAQPTDAAAEQKQAGDAKHRTEQAVSSGKPKIRLCIRYSGLEQDEGYKRLLAMLQYFHGVVPVRIYLEQEERLVDLDQVFAVDLDDDLLGIVAVRYGSGNLALLADP